MKLFELAGADPDRRFSPYCWRARLALAHKGLDAETVPWRLTEKEAIAPSGQGRVPVLIDGTTVVSDSWAIAEYLERTYPDRPSLFGGAAGMAAIRFTNHWTDTVLHVDLIKLVLIDIYAHVHEKDRDYFRSSREQRFGMKLEQVCEGREDRVVAVRRGLQPLRLTLDAQPYFGGEAPNYADYIVFGAFQWVRCISPFKILESDDPVKGWRDRLLGAFGGLAGKSPAYAD